MLFGSDDEDDEQIKRADFELRTKGGMNLCGWMDEGAGMGFVDESRQDKCWRCFCGSSRKFYYPSLLDCGQRCSHSRTLIRSSPARTLF